MTILPLDPVANATPEALRAFLGECAAAAKRAGRPRLVSISLQVDALDPLAVLESIFEPDQPHFYAERPELESAIAGAEVAAEFETRGPDRFRAVQAWVDNVLEHAIAVGDVNAPFGGPHFFTSFTFLDETEAGEPFPAARVFVPRWQVARAGGVTTAVANLLVAPDADLGQLTARVWRAHAKFRSFDYRAVRSGTGVLPMDRPGDMGVPPMDGSGSERGMGVPPMNGSPLIIRQGSYLPHWTREGGIYAVTFRLADSLPTQVVEAWRLERSALEQRILKPRTGQPTPQDLERLSILQRERIEAFLDSGAGACHLRHPEVAEIVAGALQYFDGTRYELHDWCVMPNHVHVVLRPLPGHALEEILQAWKSYTAKQANQRLGLAGEFWQPESYDHLIRDESDYFHATDYVRRNPEKAGLKDWRWVGSGKGKSMGGTPMPRFNPASGGTPVPPVIHGRDAHATSDYHSAVSRALSLIESGTLGKIVLARAIVASAESPLHPLELLNGLRQRFPSCYAFSLANGRGQSFIGASPERLVRVSKGLLETEALAGSIRRGAGASEDAGLAAELAHSDKEQREHRLVLEAITGRLTALGLAPEFPAVPGLRKLANVQHLHTPVRAALGDKVRLLDAVAALHPTPAVGGWPVAAAVERIRGLEGFPRGLYAGAIGWMNARGGGEFFVGLRSALVEGKSARLYAGSGIVAGSTPEKELAETELKFRAMLDALRG